MTTPVNDDGGAQPRDAAAQSKRVHLPSALTPHVVRIPKKGKKNLDKE